jgi:hypothetical protein
MIDTQLGQSIQDTVCSDCKAKIMIETQKLSKFDLLRPNKVAQRFAKLLCSDCTKKVVKQLRK